MNIYKSQGRTWQEISAQYRKDVEAVIKEFEENKMLVHTQLLNEFHLTPVMRETLDIYYKLHWTKSYLDSSVSIKGTIIHADVEYIPVFKCAGLIEKSAQMQLSFRKPKPEFGIPAYVLIKELKELRN